jgi:hypothetical protein
MEINSEIMPSLPSAIQRETNIIPVDIFRDIAVGNKRDT